MFGVTMPAGACYRGSIQSGIPVEESEWLQPERDDVDWHDRPVLCPGDVVDPEDVPQHHVSAHEWRIISDPASDPGVFTRLGGIVTGGPTFIVVVRSHPHAVTDHRGSLIDR